MSYHNGNCFDLIPKLVPHKGADLFLTAPPDISEIRINGPLSQYEDWQRGLLVMMSEHTKDSGFIVISQSERKINGGVYSKAQLNMNIMRDLGWKLKDQKIFVLGHTDTRCLYTFNYQVCLAFSKTGTYARKGEILKGVVTYNRKHVEGADKITKTWPDPFVDMLIEAFSPMGGLVVDPLAGPAIVAKRCLELNRRCISTELLPAIYEAGLSYLTPIRKLSKTA
jgi:hypothetical protein